MDFRLNCPYCNLSFHPNDCAIYSTLRFDDKGENVLLRPAPLFRFLARMRAVSSLEGPEYTQDAACRQCPRCKHFLPYRFEIEASFNIAMVGDAFAGKTHYLAALLHQLINDEIEQQENIRIRLKPINELAEKKWAEYQETLFEHRGPLIGNKPFTPLSQEEIEQNYSVREPLIFHLEIDYALKESVTSVMNIVFYDIAGEEIADDKKVRQFGWPILEAQAIIYFADILNIRSVLDKLPANNPQVKYAKDFIKNRPRPHVVLERIISIFKRHHRLSPEGKVGTPIAIMLSKSDMLDPIAQANRFEQARFLKDVTFNGTIDLEDMDIVNQDAQRFLKQFGELELVQDGHMLFTTASFFATSATGCALDANGKFREVKPRRCLDPLFWLLWRLTEANH